MKFRLPVFASDPNPNSQFENQSFDTRVAADEHDIARLNSKNFVDEEIQVAPKTSQELDNDKEFTAHPRTDENTGRDPDQAKSQDKDGTLIATAIIIMIIIITRYATAGL